MEPAMQLSGGGVIEEELVHQLGTTLKSGLITWVASTLVKVYSMVYAVGRVTSGFAQGSSSVTTTLNGSVKSGLPGSEETSNVNV